MYTVYSSYTVSLKSVLMHYVNDRQLFEGHLNYVTLPQTLQNLYVLYRYALQQVSYK